MIEIVYISRIWRGEKILFCIRSIFETFTDIHRVATKIDGIMGFFANLFTSYVHGLLLLVNHKHNFLLIKIVRNVYLHNDLKFPNSDDTVQSYWNILMDSKKIRNL